MTDSEPQTDATEEAPTEAPAAEAAVPAPASPVELDPIRKQKRAEIAAKEAAQREQEEQEAARVAPATVVGTPRGRVVMGRVQRVACPQFPEQVDEDGTVHPQLYVLFRTDVKQKHLENLVVIEALSDIVMRDDETEEQWRARRVERLMHLSVEQWCKRLAARVVGFEGWDFVDSATGEPIPVPNPLDWRTYIPLVSNESDLVDLCAWCMNEGWALALAKSAAF